MLHSIYILSANGFRYVAVLILLLVFLNIFRASMQEAKHRGSQHSSANNVYVGVLDVRGQGKGQQRFGLLQDCIIGRSKRCDIAIKDKNMAPIHAHVFLQGNELFITPMSRKPVKINGQRIRTRTVIQPDDNLVLGTTRATIHLLAQGEEGADGKHR